MKRNTMWPPSGQVTEGMLHKPIYDHLVRVAKAEGIANYSDIAPLAGLDMETPEDRERIGEILGIISTHEHQHGRPMLSAIVVHRQDNIPGEGFFHLARDLGLLSPKQDKIAFWCHQVAQVHKVWSV